MKPPAIVGDARESEDAVVRALLADPMFAMPHLVNIAQDDLRDGRARRVLAVARDLGAAGRLDADLLLAEVRERYTADEGLLGWLGAVTRGTPTFSTIGAHVERIREAAARRGVHDVGRRMIEGAESGLSPILVADDARQRLELLASEGASTTGAGWVEVADLLAEEDRDPPHLWPGVLIPSAVTLLAGAPKAGKSYVVTGFLSAYTAGTLWLGKAIPSGAGKGLLVSEEARQTIRRRLRRFGVGDGVAILPRAEALARAWPALVEEAGAKAHREGRAFVIFDTFSGLAGLKGEDENKAGPINEAMRPVLRIADKYGVAVLLVHHASKAAANGGTGNAARGSTALTAAVDVIARLDLHAGEDDPRRALRVIGRDSDAPPGAVVLELVREDGRPPTYRLVGSGKDARAAEVADAVLDAVRELGDPDRAAVLDHVGRRKEDARLALQAHVAGHRLVRLVPVRGNAPHRYTFPGTVPPDGYRVEGEKAKSDEGVKVAPGPREQPSGNGLLPSRGSEGCSGPPMGGGSGATSAPVARVAPEQGGSKAEQPSSGECFLPLSGSSSRPSDLLGERSRS